MKLGSVVVGLLRVEIGFGFVLIIIFVFVLYFLGSRRFSVMVRSMMFVNVSSVVFLWVFNIVKNWGKDMFEIFNFVD